MKVTPIIFSGPMVRALTEGRKSQTRRIMKPQPEPNVEGRDWGWKTPRKTVIGNNLWRNDVSPRLDLYCPYGKTGDCLYVRENVWLPREASPRESREGADTWVPDYYADGITPEDIDQYREWGWKPTPSIHMPRRVSRLTLELNDVRVERLNDITEEDAMAEGCWCVSREGFTADQRIAPAQTAKEAYRRLWESLNGPGSWETSPWVWCLSFKVHQVNINAFLKTREMAA